MDLSYLLFLIGNVIGMLVKHKTSWSNRVIPVVILAGQLIVRFVAGFTEGSADPVPLAAAAFAVSFGGLLAQLGGTVLAAVIDTGLAMATHGLGRAAQLVLPKPKV